jgi:hypothetical protein
VKQMQKRNRHLFAGADTDGERDGVTCSLTARSSKLVALLFCGTLLSGKLAVSQEQKVWSWFTSCGTKALVIDLILDGRPLYGATTPICQGTREDHMNSKKVSFTFQPPRAITWTGYRGQALTTKAGQKLSADLWQAGTDPNDLVLGISVSDGRVLYMNATHVAYPEEPSTTEIEKGLIITTHPTDTAGWVHVPGGMLIRPDCVHHVPNGGSITESGDVMVNGAVVAHFDKCAEPGIWEQSLPP